MNQYDDRFDKYLDEKSDDYARYTTFALTQYEYDGRYSQDDDAADYIRVPRIFATNS